METSMRVQHCNGPWKVYPYEVADRNGYKSVDVGSDGLAVATVHGSNQDIISKEQRDANARLIAAAPKMLEALRRIQYMPESSFAPGVKRMILDSIADATGTTELIDFREEQPV